MEEIIKDKSTPKDIKKAFIVLLIASFVGFIDISLVKMGLSKQNAEWSTFTTLIIGVGINIILFLFIFKRKNWARITFVVLTILSLLAVIPIVIQELRGDIVGAISSIIQIALYIWIIFVLLAKNSNSWFKTK